uniref:hypothetical protein n=1 Tax=Catenibacterium faecis TaxID=2764323 RepID=UPI003F8035E0
AVKLNTAGKDIDRFKNHIYELKGKSKEELKRYKYTNTQIDAIKNYDGTEEMSVKASSKIKFSVKKNTLSYNSKTGLSTVKATVSFSWNGTPEDYGNDAFAMAYEADNNHIFKEVSSVTSSLKYKEFKSSKSVKTWTKSAVNKGDQDVIGSYGWSFPLRIKGDQYYACLYKGSFSITGVVSGKLKYFNVRYLYSHKSSIVPTGFGISISRGMSSAGIVLTKKSRHTGYPEKCGGVVTCS